MGEPYIRQQLLAPTKVVFTFTVGPLQGKINWYDEFDGKDFEIEEEDTIPKEVVMNSEKED